MSRLGSRLQEAIVQFLVCPPSSRFHNIANKSAVHTGIGYLAKIISAIEDHPHAPHLTPENPLNTLLTCAAASSPNIPKGLKKDVAKLSQSLLVNKHKKKSRVNKKALKRIEEWWVNGSEEDGTLPPGAGRAMVSTTQAVDIINGGVKVNALVCLDLFL
jgi:Gly-Xaa carboxypeptidase